MMPLTFYAIKTLKRIFASAVSEELGYLQVGAPHVRLTRTMLTNLFGSGLAKPSAPK